jgi:hypothetical protein
LTYQELRHGVLTGLTVYAVKHLRVGVTEELGDDGV